MTDSEGPGGHAFSIGELRIGVATCATQIEGGRRDTNWADWAALPGRHYDWLGINYHSRTAVSGLDDGTFPNSPVNDLGWEIHPQGLVEVARWLYDRYPGPIWVTENGTADREDSFRPRFITDHLAAMVGSGLPFERYYHWCLVDNWEWAEGHTARFGLVELDLETMERRVRPSGHLLAQAIAAGAITDALYETYVAPTGYPFA